MLTSGSSQGGLLELGISLVMQDRFSNPAREASSELRRLHQEAKMAVEANIQAAEQWGNGIAQAGKQMFNVMGRALDEGLAYSDTMITVQAITEATADQMKVTSDLAKRIGVATTFSAKEVASGMQYLAMAGADIEEVQDMIEAATNLAGATNMAIGGKGGAADLMTNVMKTFRHEGKDAATFVADVLTNATLSANISMTDLAESIKYVGADAVLMKRTLPEVAAAIGTLGNAGIQGSMAGTALGNALRYLNRAMNRPNSYGASWLAKIGLQKDQLLDSTGKLKNLGEVFTMLSERIEGMSPDQQLQLMSDVFGVRGMRAAGAMVSALKDYKRLYQDILLKSEGYAEDIMKKRMEGPSGRYDMMWESIKTAAISWVEAAQPMLVRMFDMVTDFFTRVSNFFDSGIGKFTANIMALAPPITLVGGLLIKFISRWRQTQNDTLVTGKSMFRILFSGWKGMTAAAMDYERVLIQIKALQAGLAKDLNMPFDLLSMSKKQRSRVYDQILKYQAPESQYKKQIGNTVYTANRTDDGRYVLYQREVGYRKPPKKLGDYQASDVNKRLSKQLGIPDDPLAPDSTKSFTKTSVSGAPQKGPWYHVLSPIYWKEKAEAKKAPVFGGIPVDKKNRPQPKMKPVIPSALVQENQIAESIKQSSVATANQVRNISQATTKALATQSAITQLNAASERVRSKRLSKKIGAIATAMSSSASRTANASVSAASAAQSAATAANRVATSATKLATTQGATAAATVAATKSAAGAAIGAAAAGAAAGSAARGIRTAVGKGLFRYGAKSGFRFLGTKILPKILTSLVGFLGGPIGIGLTALTLLPSLISAITANKEANEENTEALSQNTLSQQQENQKKYPESIQGIQNDKELMTMLANSIAQWTKRMEAAMDKFYAGTITVNIDGKRAMEELIENKNKEYNIDMGATTGD